MHSSTPEPFLHGIDKILLRHSLRNVSGDVASVVMTSLLKIRSSPKLLAGQVATLVPCRQRCGSENLSSRGNHFGTYDKE